MGDSAYAGDIDAGQAWALLEAESSAVLVDVRTTGEWTYVGVPDLSGLGKKPVLIEWQVFPAMQINSGFTDELTARIGDRDKGRALLFLCRSGVRSKVAAMAMTTCDYTRCYNISNGFEGPLDQQGHRGGVAGWKAEHLPWVQG